MQFQSSPFTGPTFQSLRDIKVMGDITCVTVEIQDTKAVMPANFEYDHLLHPSTLDGVFQTGGTVCFGKGDGPLVPTSIKSMTIAANLPKGAGARFRGFAKISRNGYRNFTGDLIMSDDSWNEPKIRIRQFESTELSRSSNESLPTSSSSSSSAIRKMCSQLVWQRDITYVDQKEAHNLFCPKKVTDADHVTALEKAAVIYMARAISSLKPEIEDTLPTHLLQYTKWMRQRISQVTVKGLDDHHGTAESPLPMKPEDEDSFLASILTDEVEDRLLSVIGDNIPGILAGNVPPLPIMMKDDMLMNFYSDAPCSKMVVEYLDLQAFKRPDYEVLEVGGGTGSLTRLILEALGGHRGSTPRCDRFVFSDADAACIENVQKQFEDWQGLLEYKKLDIEKNPVDQGFEEESFDVLVAGSVSAREKFSILMLTTSCL